MIITQLEKMVDDTTQQQRLLKEYGLSSFMNLRCLMTVTFKGALSRIRMRENCSLPVDHKLFGRHSIMTACYIIYLYVAVIALLLSGASAKPTNPCTENQFWVYDNDGSTSCENCSPCPPGQTISPECGKRLQASAMVTCVPCKPGVSFSSKHDTLSCTPCSSCSKDQVVLRNCTKQLDIKCAKQCYSKDRYYDDDKGDCFACSRCCGDDQDVVEDECKGKLGAGSNMICSFYSSVNRCEKSTTSPQTPATIINPTTAANNHTSASQDSKREHTVPPTTQSTGSPHLSQRKDQDLLATVSIPVGILVLLVCCGCFYFFKKRQINTYFGCNRDAESGSHDSVTEGANEGEAEETLTKDDTCTFYKYRCTSPESREPLLKQGDPELLFHKNMSEVEEDSKLLSSLLQHESDDVQQIYDRLDTEMPGVGHYRAVALYYGLDHYQITSRLETYGKGPSRALIEWLAATKPELTVKEFVTVVRKETNRNDVANLLGKYDADVKKEMYQM